MKIIIVCLLIMNVGLSLAHAIRNKTPANGWIPSVLGWTVATLTTIIYVP